MLVVLMLFRIVALEEGRQLQAQGLHALCALVDLTRYPLRRELMC